MYKFFIVFKKRKNIRVTIIYKNVIEKFVVIALLFKRINYIV